MEKREEEPHAASINMPIKHFNVFAFNALTLLVWHQEEHLASKNGVMR